MAKKQQRELIKLVSTAGTGYFYTTSRKKNKDKVQTKKYDPKVQKHVLFKEGKVK